MKKQLLAAFMAICMVLTLLPTNALATEIVPDGSTGVTDNDIESTDDDTEVSGNNTKVPDNNTEVPGNSTEVPGNNTEVPDNSTAAPDDAGNPLPEDADLVGTDEDAGIMTTSMVTSGTCGASVTWNLAGDGTLTISGTGEMEYLPTVPWERSAVKKVIIENGVTKIAAQAFMLCSNLTSVKIPGSVTDIADSAFNGCSSLICIDIPEGVTRIGWTVFEDCSNLRGIKIPRSVSSIGYDAFYGCTKLTDVYYAGSEEEGAKVCGERSEAHGGSVQHIGNIPGLRNNIHYNGTGCGSNFTWNLAGNGTLTISGTGGMTVFFDRLPLWEPSDVKQVIINSGVTSIMTNAFSDCTNLTSVKIPDSVTSIGNFAFNECSSLTDIIIPSSVRGIGERAFYKCTKLTGIEIPDGVTSIGDEAFRGCSGLTGVEIPDSVASVGAGAFMECSELTSISMPDSVAVIKGGTFYKCVKLTSVRMPNGLTEIGFNAFQYCGSLETVYIPSSVGTIGYDAFSECTKLTDVSYAGSREQGKKIAYNVPGGYVWGIEACFRSDIDITYNSGGQKPAPVSGICGSGLRYKFESATGTLTISKELWIGTGEMYHYGEWPLGTGPAPWDNLTVKKVVIEDGVKSIGNCAFYNKTALSSIEISDSVTSIGSRAFKGCSGLTGIEIPDKVTSIGSEAFRGCSGLTIIKIPGKVTSIGAYAFEGCSGLTGVQMTPTEISLFSRLTSIEKNVFENCSGLTSIEIPAGVIRIGSSAFRNCSNLKSILIPESVFAIEGAAFSFCGKLKDVVYTGSKGQWNIIKIRESNDCLKNANIHCSGGDEENRGKKVIVSDLSVPKEKSAIVVIDGKTGEAIKDALVWRSDQGENAGQRTDEEGVVKLDDTGSWGYHVKKEGYHQKSIKKYLEKEKVSTVYLVPDTNEMEIVDASLRWTGGREYKDVLNDIVYLCPFGLLDSVLDLEKSTVPFTLTVQSAGNPKKFELLQNGKTIKESEDGVFDLTGECVVDSDGSTYYCVEDLLAGFSVHVRVYDENGEYKDQELGIRVSKNINIARMLKKMDGSEISLPGYDGNDKGKVTLPNGLPFIGGEELEFGFSKKMPIAVNVDDGGKVRVSINMGNKEWSKKEDEFKSLKERVENELVNAFGEDDLCSFGAGMASAKASVVAYGDGWLDDETGTACISAEFIVKLEGGAEHTQYYLTPIPLYLSWNVDGSIELKGKAEWSYGEEGRFVPSGGDFALTLTAETTLAAGIGLRNVMSVEASGTLTLELLFKHKEEQVTLSGGAEISYTIFGEKMPAYKIERTGIIYPKSEKSAFYADRKMRAAIDGPDLSDAEWISMDYLSKREADSETLVLGRARTVDSGSVRLVRYAYENAAPRLVKAGDKLYLFYLDGVSGRRAQNQTALFYKSSADDGTTWSVPVRVDQNANETADYDFDIAVSGDGSKIYAIWSDAGAVYGDEIASMDPAEAIAKVGREMNLMLAEIVSSNGSVTTTRTIRTDAGDLVPRVAVGADGVVYAAWTTDDMSSAEGMFDGSNKVGICYASSTDNYAVHNVSVGEKPYPLTLDVGMVGGKICLAADVDVDGNLSTQDDREIYIAELAGAGDKTLTAQTSNQDVDSVPQFGKVNGQNCLFWYQNGNIAYTSDRNATSLVFNDGELPSIGQRFSVLEGASGKASIVWTTTSLVEEAGVDMFCTDFDGSKWSKAYRLDGIESEFTSPVSGYLDDVSLRMAYLGRAYEEDGLYSHIYLCRPEERIDTSVAMSVLAEKEAAGAAYPVQLRVTNEGNKPISSLVISSTDGRISTKSIPMQSPLMPGCAYDFTWNDITLPANMTDVYTCDVTVKTPEETDLSKNSFHLSIGEPDLSVEAYLDFSNGNQFAGVIVENDGILSSDALLTIYKDEDRTKELYRTTLSGIAGGESKISVFDLTMLDPKAPVFYFTVFDLSGKELYTGDNEEMLYVGKGRYLETDTPDEDDTPDGDDNPGSGNQPGENDNGRPSSGNGGGNAAAWIPTLPDEKERRACVGQEAVQYTQPKDRAYRVEIENSIQGPQCFDSFKAVLGDYTIGRTYNIYPDLGRVYGMREEVQFTMKIPKALYKSDRKYKMICVTGGGVPIIYEDLDDNPETITIQTDRFYAYALVYKEQEEIE